MDHQSFASWELRLVFRLMRRATSLVHTSEMKILLNLSLIIIIIIQTDIPQEQTSTGFTFQEKKAAEDWERLQLQSDSNVQDYRSTSAKQRDPLIVLRSEIPSGICAKLRTVAARNNRVHMPWSLYYCFFAPHIWYCSSRTSRSWRNTTGEVVTISLYDNFENNVYPLLIVCQQPDCQLPDRYEGTTCEARVL